MNSNTQHDELQLERRKGPDQIQRSFNYVALIVWALFVVSMLAFHFARPEQPYAWTYSEGISQARTSWDENYQFWFLLFLWSCCGLTLLTIALNWLRSRRRNDYMRVNLLLLALIVIASLLAYYLGVFNAA
ncbi:hypothetical protein DBZ36_08275 [Alginatibacterium sediminis]|uniref:Uncharacterized protein n=1 Tax=Alginatibacterium sediminis TaxID=2164068 RepID=A0A420EIF3_9ALTE|nr:hypothetical protein [Alginatibacterium sediminis]RKF20424.1 hypothetical protein DBZ36_08275 [Alginatibacterium sediminis]